MLGLTITPFPLLCRCGAGGTEMISYSAAQMRAFMDDLQIMREYERPSYSAAAHKSPNTPQAAPWRSRNTRIYPTNAARQAAYRRRKA